MTTTTRVFVAKASLALVALVAGMLTVIGAEWLLHAQFDLQVPPAIRNVFAVAFGVFLANKIVGKELAEQFQIEKDKRNG